MDLEALKFVILLWGLTVPLMAYFLHKKYQDEGSISLGEIIVGCMIAPLATPYILMLLLVTFEFKKGGKNDENKNSTKKRI